MILEPEMYSDLTVLAISFATVIFVIFCLKSVVFLFSHGMGTLNKNRGKERITKYVLDKGRRGKKFLSAAILAILIFCLYLISRNFIFSIFSAICLWIYIIGFLNNFEEKRKQLLSGQIVEFLSNMAVMLKAGNTVRNVFKSSAGCFKNPLNKYLVDMANELELNFTLDETLDRFSRRCRSREVDLLVSSLKINSRIGGDLIPIIDSVADSIRHNLKLKSKINIMSLQSRYSGNIISILPIIILILMCIFFNDTVMNFFSTGAGIISLVIGGSLEIAGIFIIKKIIGSGNSSR
ncbi:MAG: type II secretion system F family protein [Actinomycetota bacterium]|nr:type II secretion system F family protein [Actinomycetota bacterium]